MLDSFYRPAAIIYEGKTIQGHFTLFTSQIHTTTANPESTNNNPLEHTKSMCHHHPFVADQLSLSDLPKPTSSSSFTLLQVTLQSHMHKPSTLSPDVGLQTLAAPTTLHQFKKVQTQRKDCSIGCQPHQLLGL
jgi:hypothetical protein